jgi:hypothetical protein
VLTPPVALPLCPPLGDPPVGDTPPVDIPPVAVVPLAPPPEPPLPEAPDAPPVTPGSSVMGPLQLALSPEIDSTDNTLRTLEIFTTNTSLEHKKASFREECEGTAAAAAEGYFVLPSGTENCTVNRTRSPLPFEITRGDRNPPKDERDGEEDRR